MIRRVRIFWENTRESLWFVPAVMILGSIALAVAMIELSDLVNRKALEEYPRIFGAGAESSRQMLSTIASAMMTVAGVTFSITIVAVTQASSQYTPRILRNFMRDRPNQITLGTLTGVFVYCLVVIRTIRGVEDIRFIPALAVLMAFVLAIVAIGVLIFFIHHVASSLQATGILARVSKETLASIERLFPETMGRETEPPRAVLDALGPWFPVPAAHTGYLRSVDQNGLLDFAARHESVVRMEVGVGDHAIEGSPIISVTGGAPSQEDAQALSDMYDIGNYRTVEQDAAFGIRQMVDMAVKALSPGVNDTTTAITCIDSLGSALVALANRRIEDRYRMHEGRLAVIALGPTFESLVRTAVDEIRQNANGNVSVLTRLLRMLEVVAHRTSSPERHAILLGHGERVLAVSERTVPDVQNRLEVRDAFEQLRDAALIRDHRTAVAS